MVVVTDEQDKTKCPYCGVKMLKWMPPEDSAWDRVYQLVCFNDECPYYVEGWQHMKSTYQQTASYRHRYDPHTGEKGPLPTWSPMAHRGRIIAEEDDQQ